MHRLGVEIPHNFLCLHSLRSVEVSSLGHLFGHCASRIRSRIVPMWKENRLSITRVRNLREAAYPGVKIGVSFVNYLHVAVRRIPVEVPGRADATQDSHHPKCPL